MRTLAERVVEYIRRQELLKAGDRLGVAVSGGADSVSLLRLMIDLRRELGIVLSVVHFNHKLRGEASDADERFVAELAERHKLELHGGGGDVAAHAAEKHLSLEAAARELRYQFFWRILREDGLNRIATAHTLDDQAETVLLRVARGAGTRGLAGIYPQLSEPSSRFSVPGSQFAESFQLSAFSSQENRTIVRPLLAVRRKDLETYLNALGQLWREDSSNRDLRHSRNRVRHGILPRLERELNPAVREALAETAEIARAEEEYWERETARVLPQICRRGAGATLSLAALADLPLALRRRVVRAAAESLGLRLEFRQVEEILEVAGGRAKSARLREGWFVSRNKHELRFEMTDAAPGEVSPDYEYRLPVPGQIEVPEAGTRIEAKLIPGNASQGYNPENLFDPSALAKELLVRNWRAGDRYWPAHTKSPKKVKELLQDRHLSGTERKLWPVVVSGSELVWVRGFAAPERLRLRESATAAVVIQECESLKEPRNQHESSR